eukprot:scaffold1182_cov396-Prasinococcus_capsulatus_cf.AAC.6
MGGVCVLSHPGWSCRRRCREQTTHVQLRNRSLALPPRPSVLRTGRWFMRPVQASDLHSARRADVVPRGDLALVLGDTAQRLAVHVQHAHLHFDVLVHGAHNTGLGDAAPVLWEFSSPSQEAQHGAALCVGRPRGGRRG